MSEKRSVRISDQAANRDAGGQSGRFGSLSKKAAGRLQARQAGGWNCEEVHQFIAPTAVGQPQKLSPRGIAEIRRVYGASCQLPQNPAVHRARAEVAVRGPGKALGDILQQPLNLAGRK